MCTVCGCGTATVEIPEHVTIDAKTGDMHFGLGSAHVNLPHVSQERTIKIEQDVLSANASIAERNRRHFVSHGVKVFNLVSSPGSGKTTLLCATIQALRERYPSLPVAVVEGDQQTSNDADRIRATGVPAIQVNTGKGCHLDAMMIEHAFANLPIHDHSHASDHSHDSNDDTSNKKAKTATPNLTGLQFALVNQSLPSSLLFIENVGNLVCPAMWDLGEKAKVAILSVTEGEDKPIKYPDMFAVAEVMVLNKIDLLPYLNFDVAKCIDYAKRVNPTIQILPVSATTGEGMQAWLDWLIQA